MEQIAKVGGGGEILYTGDLEHSLEGFASALPELARHGGGGRYELEFEVRDLRNLILRFPKNDAKAWLFELRRQCGIG